MFTKLQCCQKERDSQQEGDGGDSREMEGYRVKTNSIANWIFIECWRGIASWNKNKPKQQNGECFGSQKTENTHKKNAYSLPDISSRFVFCNFCFSVLTFSCCFDIFCNFFSLFHWCVAYARMKVLLCFAVGVLSPKVNSSKFNFPRQTKVWGKFPPFASYAALVHMTPAHCCCCSSSSSFIPFHSLNILYVCEETTGSKI